MRTRFKLSTLLCWVVGCASAPTPETPASTALAPVLAARRDSTLDYTVRQPTTVPPAAVEHPVEPPVAPEPAEPFAGQSQVTVQELLAQLQRLAQETAVSPTVRADYVALLHTHDLIDSDSLYQDYVRVRLVFEATRDGGLWGLRWDITNREGVSDAIWKQWRSVVVPEPAPDWIHTATAECDELSALFAYLVRQLGVKRVGLNWPKAWHTTAVWTVSRPGRPDVRLTVPTSQVFLSRTATLGTQESDPYVQRKIWDYWRHDARPSDWLGAPLARYFVRVLERYGTQSHEQLQARRNRYGGS